MRFRYSWGACQAEKRNIHVGHLCRRWAADYLPQSAVHFYALTEKLGKYTLEYRTHAPTCSPRELVISVHAQPHLQLFKLIEILIAGRMDMLGFGDELHPIVTE